MKYGVPLATVFLIALAVRLHSSGARPETPGRRSPVGREAGRKTAAELVSAPEVRRPEAASVSSEQRAGAVPLRRTASVPPWRPIAALLDRELALTPVQQSAVEEALQEREIEIRACHEAIRTLGVLDMRDYEWQVARMKGAWYRRIAALLDSVQHERFCARVEEGLFNEGLAFTVEPGMAVLE